MASPVSFDGFKEFVAAGAYEGGVALLVIVIRTDGGKRWD